MDSVEDYARRWTKSEKEELDFLPEWVKKAILDSAPSMFDQKCVPSILLRLFNKPEVIKELNRLHEEYVLIPANKAFNNIVFVCKAHYYQCIINQLGINSALGNRTYTPTTFFQR
jgi:hypothetical protein